MLSFPIALVYYALDMRPPDTDQGTRLRIANVNTTPFPLNCRQPSQGIFISKMAAAQKLYPRATLKKIVKAHSKKNLSKNVDPLVSCREGTSRLEYRLTMT